MRITFISDTHTKHAQITQDLPGGDLLIHAGDLMNSGYYWEEVYPFLDWYNNLGNYDHKVFIAGNHDRLFEDEAEKIKGLLYTVHLGNLSFIIGHLIYLVMELI